MKRVKRKNINQRVQPVWIHNKIHRRMAPKELDCVTLATVRELLKVQESIFQIVIWANDSKIDFESGQCGEGCSGDAVHSKRCGRVETTSC